MEHIGLAAVGFAILAYGLVSRRLQTTILTGPIVFVAFGVLVGPHALGLADLDAELPVIKGLAELTLALILFTDASRIDLRLLRREHDLPLRMLAIGLPLTIAAGAVLALPLFGGLGLLGGAVLAAILAPTDAALGQAVVSNERVPLRIRQTLNVESGLNDGIALPCVLILISFAGMMGHAADKSAAFWIQFAALQIVLGPLVGILVGYAGGKLIEAAARRRWISGPFLRLSALGLALLAMAAAELVGGNGFIAAFTAGLMLGNFTDDICESLYEFGEAEGQLLTMLTFIIFGAVMVPPAVAALDWRIGLYALLSLTVVRMVPVWLSLQGTGLRGPSFLFLGWFGPRGIASILFVILVLSEASLLGAGTIVNTVTVTVLASVILHGMSAYPAAAWYGRLAARMTADDDPCLEDKPVTAMPLRQAAR